MGPGCHRDHFDMTPLLLFKSIMKKASASFYSTAHPPPTDPHPPTIKYKRVMLRSNYFKKYILMAASAIYFFFLIQESFLVKLMIKI